MKIFILTKKSLFAIGLCLMAGILALWGISSSISVTTNAKVRKLPIYAVQTNQKKACLTFDAAWGNEDTQELINILGKYNAKATFFVVGEWVDKYPESVKALAEAGHEIMNHSNTHPNLPKLAREEIRSEIRACNDKIEKVTGIRPNLLRPPYGDYNNALLEVIEEENMYAIQWDVDSLDWKNLSAADIQTRVLSGVTNGSIILFHNAAMNTPAALPGIIEKLQADGYELVTVNDLIYKNNYTLDNTGRQVSNSDITTAIPETSQTELTQIPTH